MPPMHKVGLNPHLALHRNLKIIELLDELGYDEAWIGEHHSAGSELISSPEVFIATAAERTRNIKLGTGVSSLPYHHPFMLADRIVLLDHLTRGRTMFGVGPGQLTSDAAMLGIDPATQRPRMEQAFDVMMRLFRGETVTEHAGWFTCQDAVLQMKPYSNFDVAVAASISPSGSRTGWQVRGRTAVDCGYRPDGCRDACRALADRSGERRRKWPHRESRQVATHGADVPGRHLRGSQAGVQVRPGMGVRIPVAHHPVERTRRCRCPNARQL